MLRSAWATVWTYGNAGAGASSYWSAMPAAGLDRHAAKRAMAVKPAFIAAQRPLGLAGGATG